MQYYIFCQGGSVNEAIAQLFSDVTVQNEPVSVVCEDGERRNFWRLTSSQFKTLKSNKANHIYTYDVYLCRRGSDKPSLWDEKCTAEEFVNGRQLQTPVQIEFPDVISKGASETPTKKGSGGTWVHIPDCEWEGGRPPIAGIGGRH